MVMPNKEKKLVRMRTLTGEVIEVPLEFIDPYANQTLRIAGDVTVRRRKVTFIKDAEQGVSPDESVTDL